MQYIDTKGDIDHCSSNMVNTRLANKSSEFKAYLASEAAKKSDGTFLWLHLLGRELDPGENAKRLRDIVSEMPADINETYERDLEKVQILNPLKKQELLQFSDGFYSHCDLSPFVNLRKPSL